jgi:hypothetical protein
MTLFKLKSITDSYFEALYFDFSFKIPWRSEIPISPEQALKICREQISSIHIDNVDQFVVYPNTYHLDSSSTFWKRTITPPPYVYKEICQCLKSPNLHAQERVLNALLILEKHYRVIQHKEEIIEKMNSTFGDANES